MHVHKSQVRKEIEVNAENIRNLRERWINPDTNIYLGQSTEYGELTVLFLLFYALTTSKLSKRKRFDQTK